MRNLAWIAPFPPQNSSGLAVHNISQDDSGSSPSLSKSSLFPQKHFHGFLRWVCIFFSWQKKDRISIRSEIKITTKSSGGSEKKKERREQKRCVVSLRFMNISTEQGHQKHVLSIVSYNIPYDNCVSTRTHIYRVPTTASLR